MVSEMFRIRKETLDEINCFLLDPGNPDVQAIHRVVAKYGTPTEINAKAKEARCLSNLMGRLERMGSPYLENLKWLVAERDRGAFIPVSQYRKKILGDEATGKTFRESTSVTLEISALQYFPFLIAEAEQAIDGKEIMPGRYIRVRKMKEQESDQGDILAVAAAMQIVGASYVETLDTKGTDGSNIHLGGPETITGYFGGIGQPNDHALAWVDELLHYYTNYGINEVLNINPGTVLLGYLLYRLGVDVRFKISVFMGNDNPYAVLWTLMMAKLFAREDGSTPLIGFNLSNSVDAEALMACADIRRRLGLEDKVRIEHHITETYRSIVRQPYNRREDLLKVARVYPNISAKHEGGDPEVEQTIAHPSDILDYFRDKEEVIASGDMDNLKNNYLKKHDATNRTAEELTRAGLSFLAASRLHAR
ncbi:MAG TPA: hypothetical protein PLK59_07770 [Synergistales bacterium]|nr:hypothetical protein [Synergistales bacterium]MDI9392308.1 hypothetical protein [Synergistota bacterium]HRV70805.1 hypothetical protein [Thermovirgaceae bacterium]MDD5514940.1 hypothetical protein [Synergistales bacterium]HOI82172.1 hypothetical protein [Synergistales bacterium]